MYPFIFLFFFAANFPDQVKTDHIIDLAYANARKGVYWGLSQSSAKQNIVRNNLIDNDKLISAVRVEKGVNGLHIESTGYFEGNEVKISIYKSLDNLIKEGFLLPPRPDSLVKTSGSKKRKKT